MCPDNVQIKARKPKISSISGAYRLISPFRRHIPGFFRRWFHFLVVSFYFYISLKMKPRKIT